jgi:HEPN domain-containing protein
VLLVAFGNEPCSMGYPMSLATPNPTKFPPLEGSRREKFVLKQADAFHRAGQLTLQCAAREEEKFHLALVYGVNGAFAVELYLKCLLAVEGSQTPATHNLIKLFNQLSRESRDKLRREHDQVAKQNSVLSRFRQRGINTDLDSLLEDGQDTFERFRYLFEGIPDRLRPVGFALDLFGQIVRNRILDLRPEWVSDELPSAPNS